MKPLQPQGLGPMQKQFMRAYAGTGSLKSVDILLAPSELRQNTGRADEKPRTLVVAVIDSDSG